MTKISIIVAVDAAGGIGASGDLLCYLPDDLKHFKRLTSGHTVVMGRKTFDSLPNGALPNRVNIVVSRNAALALPGAHVVGSLDEALALARELEIEAPITTSAEPSAVACEPSSVVSQARPERELFIIGGGSIYNQALPLADRLYLTRIDHTFAKADTFFPTINKEEWREVSRELHPVDDRHPFGFVFETLERIR